MQVSKETRTVTLSAEDLARVAGLASPEQWKFIDGGPDATATLERTE